jgi:hypothetical protein
MRLSLGSIPAFLGVDRLEHMSGYILFKVVEL